MIELSPADKMCQYTAWSKSSEITGHVTVVTGRVAPLHRRLVSCKRCKTNTIKSWILRKRMSKTRRGVGSLRELASVVDCSTSAAGKLGHPAISLRETVSNAPRRSDWSALQEETRPRRFLLCIQSPFLVARPGSSVYGWRQQRVLATLAPLYRASSPTEQQHLQGEALQTHATSDTRPWSRNSRALPFASNALCATLRFLET